MGTFLKPKARICLMLNTLKIFLIKSDISGGLRAPLLLDMVLEFPVNAIRKG